MKLIIVPIVAIAAITGLIGYAMSLNINGVVLSSGLMVIAGIAGYEAKVIKDRINKPK